MTGAYVQGDQWVRVFRPNESAERRVFFLPHAGGSATYFHPFSLALPPSIEGLAVQYPGRQDRRTEACVNDLHVLAEMAYDALLPWLDRPFAVFGHSMGASLGFEVARRLEAAGRPPVALFVSGRRAPSRFRGEQTYRLADRELIRSLQRLQGTDARLFEDEEIVQMILPALRGDYTAAETYQVRPGPPLQAPIVVLTGRQDDQVTPEEAQAWQQHTTSAFRVRTFEGGHFFLAERVLAIVDEISQAFENFPDTGGVA